MKGFSAFRLFYDNFLYRNNVMIEYDKINKYINKITEILKEVTNLYHDDIEIYKSNLTVYQSKIKKELDKIMEVYPYFFEKYFELYSRYVENNNSIKEMPFVLSCSFFNDYEFNKVAPDYVQRFSSLDKKRLRDRAKKMSFVEYYKEILKDFDSTYYDKLIDLLDAFINIDVNIKISFDDNLDKYIKTIKRIVSTNRRILEKAKLSSDYNLIKDKMELIYKGCFDDFDSTLESKLNNYLLFLYENKKKNVSDFYDTIVTNDLSYGIFKDFVSKEKKYKEKYDKIFAKHQIINPNKVDIAPSIRQRLIKLYYDERFNFEESKDIKKNIEIINGLKSLADNIEQLIWEQLLFNASHSLYLKRNNTVRYAIINFLYSLYNPLEILDRYEKLRKEITLYLKNNSSINSQLDFKLLDNEKIVSKKDILANVHKERIIFINEQIESNLVSKSLEYDTRDYDLFYIAEDLSTQELVDIFNKNSKNNRLNTRDLLEYVCQCILKVTNPSYSIFNPDYEMISDVARTYFGLEYEIELDADIYLKSRDMFNISYESFLNNSAFYKLKKEYKL